MNNSQSGKWSLFVAFCIVLFSFPLPGQQNTAGVEDYYETNIRTNRTGMYALGTWATGNIALGAYGWSRTTGETKYFHQMNTLWNTVNLGLAASGLFGLRKTPREEQALLDHSRRLERIFLINAGLDVLYMGTGLWLWEMENTDAERQHQLNGYGKSLLLQGAFLFAFDLVMFGIKKSQRKGYLQEVRISTAPEISGLSITFNW
jgi:hypothetical protein